MSVANWAETHLSQPVLLSSCGEACSDRTDISQGNISVCLLEDIKSVSSRYLGKAWCNMGSSEVSGMAAVHPCGSLQARAGHALWKVRRGAGWQPTGLLEGVPFRLAPLRSFSASIFSQRISHSVLVALILEADILLQSQSQSQRLAVFLLL